ncbi:MAG: hypothetical protein M1813_000561 [Trichoglossum hirsutum]|nr:MAG: hypothetical protein M1813_000561 [Trichoglossum hirsutum]
MPQSLNLRPCIELDHLPQLCSRLIAFHHPGYPTERYQDILFRLRGFDSSGGGLHHRTARLACAIVAGNAWDGYLTEQRASSPRVALGEDDILTRDDYWFHIPTTSSSAGGDLQSSTGLPPSLSPYPVIPSFQHWQFPHGNLPPGWVHNIPAEPVVEALSNLTMAVKVRDRFCRVSQCRDRTEVAHVCPRTEYAWFCKNNMGWYNADDTLNNASLIDDQRNVFLLRRDLHSNFDDRKFVLVPKGDAGRWVVHLLETTYELGKLYHNVTTHDINAVAVEFLLTRFAWAIFSSLRGFLQAGVKRYLILCETKEDVGINWGNTWVSADECHDYTSASQDRRSQSPKKGSRGIQEADEDNSSDRTSNLPTCTPPPRCPSTPDSATELAEDIALFRKTLPRIIDPANKVECSTDPSWHNLERYPGSRSVRRLKESYLAKERKAVEGRRQMLEEEGGHWLEEEEGDQLDYDKEDLPDWDEETHGNGGCFASELITSI